MDSLGNEVPRSSFEVNEPRPNMIKAIYETADDSGPQSIPIRFYYGENKPQFDKNRIRFKKSLILNRINNSNAWNYVLFVNIVEVNNGTFIIKLS